MSRAAARSGLMRITAVEAWPLATPRPEAQPGAADHFLPYRERLAGVGVRGHYSACFVRIRTDEGLSGQGECTVREVPQAHAAIIERLLRPLLVDEDPFDVEVLWERMLATMRTRGHTEGFLMEAISGVDLALWDLLGQAVEKPVHKLLGGAHSDRVKAYASSVYFGPPDAVAEEVRRLVEAGHDEVKLKVGMDAAGLGRDADVANLKAIRDAVGYGVRVMVDANSAYTAAQAVRVGRKFERYEVYWFEEPVPPDDLDGYVKVARALDVPICGSESLFGRYNFRDLICREAVDIVQFNVARCGGLTEAKKIVALAAAYNLPITLHNGLSGAGCRAAGLHLAATLPRELFLTFEYMYRPTVIGNEVLEEPLERFEKGFLALPQSRGLGIRLRQQVLERYRAG